MKEIAVEVKMGIQIVNVLAIIPRAIDPARFAEILEDAMSQYSDMDPNEPREVGESRLLEQLGCKSWGECHKKWYGMAVSESARSKGWVLTVFGRVRRGPYVPPYTVYLRQPKVADRAAQILREMDKYDGVKR